MACFNRNTQEYKELLRNFSSNLEVDGIITRWQTANNTDTYPTLTEAKLFLKNNKIAFSLNQKAFAEAILGNLDRKNLISKFKGEYYVVKSNTEGVNKQILQSNLNKIKRYLDINNIPQDAVKFEITRNSVRISINESIFTPKDIIESSRGWDENRSRHIVGHLMRIFPGIKLKLVSVAEAQAYYDGLPAFQKANIPFEKVKSYFDPAAGQVVLIKGRVTDETAIEEMLHPFIDALFVDNKALFDSLLSEAKIMFPVLSQQIEDAYNKDRGFNQKDRDFELVTQALTRHFKKEYEENPTKTFKERIKEFLQWFANIINNLHKYITGKNINQVQIASKQTQQSTIKPGVSEVFESNPELANAVYEALGFDNLISKVTLSKKFADTYNIVYNGEIIGTIDIPSDLEGNTISIGDVNIKPEFRGKGLGVETYKAAMKIAGKPLESFMATDEANRVWNSLIKQGLAKKTDTGFVTISSQITPQQKQQAQQLYSQYLDTIFPDSKVKDIVYHGTPHGKFDKFDFSNIGTGDRISIGHYFLNNLEKVQRYLKGEFISGNKPTVIQALVNVKNAISQTFGEKLSKEEVVTLLNKYEKFAVDKEDFTSFVKFAEPSTISKVYSNLFILSENNQEFIKTFIKNENIDSFFQGKEVFINPDSQLVILDSDNVHILGSKQDIEGFKEFVSKPAQAPSEVVEIDLKDINPNTTLSDIAKLLNTSDIKFDLNAIADPKIRFSLTPDLESVVKFALTQSNDIQEKIIRSLFHQAEETEQDVTSLSAGVSGPIVVLNEENHVYYNLLDTTETFRSTTERIKGTLSEEDMFNKKLNIDLGNDFDKLLQALTSNKKLDDVFTQMKVLERQQAEKAFLTLKENLNELTRGGGVAIPQVVVYDRATKTAGTIDILIVLPNGKLKIVDLKTSKNSVRDMASNERDLKYDVKYDLAQNSDLKNVHGIQKLSTRSQQGLQVNIYRRMLENMGYQVDNSDTGASTFHIQVGIEGKDSNQVFTGEFKSDDWVLHPASQNKPYVDMLIPENKDLYAQAQINKILENSKDGVVNWDTALSEDEKLPEDNTDETEFEVITEALEKYRIGLMNKQIALNKIKSSVFTDRTKDQTIEDVATALSLINIALTDTLENRSELFTNLITDANREIDTFINYMQDPQNFNKPEYITYALNFNRFTKTYEGLHSIKDLKGLKNNQVRLVLTLIAKLNSLSANDQNSKSIIDTAIFNYVKEQIKTFSKREDLSDDILNEILNGGVNIRDIGGFELEAMDIATSRDTILAIMDKIYKIKKQQVLTKSEERNRIISGLASRLLKLSPGKNVQDLYDFMLEFDKDGEFTGEYVKKIGRQYYNKLHELRDKLTDDSGNWLEYRVIEDLSTASKEDIDFNINLAKAKADFSNFWSAERLGANDELLPGEYHSYTEEFKRERLKYQYFIDVNGKPYWLKRKGVSEKAYQVFLAKYHNPVTYVYAVKNDDGNFTGATIAGREFNAVKPEYRIINDYNSITGESLLSKKYESIMNPTDALGQAQKDFYLAYLDIYEKDLLNKLLPGTRSQMLGSVPIIKGKLFQDLKDKPNAVTKLWASMTRSVKNFVSETTEQRGVVVDELGNIIDSLPVFYTGKVRTEEELNAIEKEIDNLNDSRKRGLIKEAQYSKEIKILNAKLSQIRNKPSKSELNKDMATGLMMFGNMAEHYEVMTESEDIYRAFIKVLEKRRYAPANPNFVTGIFNKGKFESKAFIEGADSLVLKRAKKWMSMVYYNNEEINKNFLTKVLDGLITYSSLSYVAFNPFGNFNNYALGRINNSIEALGGRFFSGSAYARAEVEFNKQAIPALLYRSSAASKKLVGTTDYDPELPSNKYEALVDYFRMMDSKSDIRETISGPPPVSKSYFQRFADFGYILQDAAEYNVQTKVGMAILMDTMIMNSNTGDILSLYDAYEFDNETKTVKLKSGYDKLVSLDSRSVDKNTKPSILNEKDYTETSRYLIRNEIREVNKQIHGNYAKDDRMVLQQHALGRLVAQFHKWVVPAINARFRSEYFDENLGWLEGRYRSFWKFLAYTAKELTSLQLEFGKHQENFLVEYGYTGDGSQQDQRAKDKLLGAYRTLGEIGFIMVTFALSSIFASLFANDDEDEDTPFEKKMKNFLRYQTDRTYKELILFTPLGAKQVWQMFDSPIAATRTLGELGEALALSVTTPLAYLIKGEEEFYLDKDYVYQRGVRKGELKLYKNWEDVIPILYSIKKWEDFNNLTNFYIK